MKFLLLCSAILLGASAGVVPIEDGLNSRDAVKAQLAKRVPARKGGDSGTGPNRGDPDDLGGIGPKPESEEQANAMALSAKTFDQVKDANADLGPATRSMNKPIYLRAKLELNRDDVSTRTGDNAIFVEEDASGKPIRLWVYEGDPEQNKDGTVDQTAGGGHSANLGLEIDVNGDDWTDPPDMRLSTEEEKDEDRKLIAKYRESVGEYGVKDEKNFASQTYIDPERRKNGVRVVTLEPENESIGVESKLMAEVRRNQEQFAKDYPKDPPLPTKFIPNGKATGRPIGRVLIGPGNFDYHGVPIKPLKIIDPTGNWSPAKANPSITKYTGPKKRSVAAEEESMHDFFFGLMKERLTKRQLGGLMADQSNGPDNTTQVKQQLQNVIGYRIDVQNNITDLIWPTIVNMTAGAGDDLDSQFELYMMALSLFVDLTLAPINVGGPFRQGQTAYASMTASSPEEALYWAFLTDTYNTAWANASGLVAKAGLDVELQTFVNLTDVNNTSLLPPPSPDWNQTVENMMTPFFPTANTSANASELQAINQTMAAFLSSPNVTALLPPFEKNSTNGTIENASNMANNTRREIRLVA